MTPLKAYLARECAIGSVINVVIGSAFFLVIFSGQTAPQVWGGRGLIVDCLPQGFMIGLMSIIPAMLITRKRALNGLSLPVSPSPRPLLPRGIAARGILVALVTMVSLVGVAAGLALATGVTTVPFWPAFVLKAIPGLLVPWIVIPSAIKAALLVAPSPASPA